MFLSSLQLTPATNTRYRAHHSLLCNISRYSCPSTFSFRSTWLFWCHWLSLEYPTHAIEVCAFWQSRRLPKIAGRHSLGNSLEPGTGLSTRTCKWVCAPENVLGSRGRRGDSSSFEISTSACELLLLLSLARQHHGNFGSPITCFPAYSFA